MELQAAGEKGLLQLNELKKFHLDEGQRLKFIASTRAMHGYQKMRDFTKDPKEEILGNQNFQN